MADEKKPKIDLKARLGKAGGATPPPAGAGIVPPPQAAVPAPTPMPGAPQGVPQSVRPAPMPTPGPSPVGVGVPVGPPPAFSPPSRPPPGMDPNHPLAAAMGVKPVARPAPAPAAAPQPTRIEVDEMAVQQAAKGGRKQGVIAGLVAAVVFAAVGYLAGGASSESTARKKSIQDAQELAKDVGAAKDKLKDMADKLEAGRNSLTKDKKFPDTLAKDLGGINVDFAGDKLAFRRFSGFSTDATSGLTEFITAVTGVNDRKSAIIGLLSKLQKPITEQFKAAASGAASINQVVLLGRQDESRNNYAMLANLQAPISITQGNINLPNEFTFIDPQSKQPAKLSKYTTGDLTKPAALYVPPKAFEAVCPSDVSSQAAQLAVQIKRIIDDIRGEGAGQPADPNGAIVEPKPGMLERADKLMTNLQKVGGG
jgi:hypothetical protein